MKLNKLKAVATSVKVDHPLAKYNSRGDLYCLLCNTQIKNANVWKVHLASKSHKDKYLLFKSGKLDAKSNEPQKTVKRAPPKTEAPPRSLKKQKIADKSEEKKSDEAVPPDDPDKPKSILKNTSKVVPKLPEGFVPKSREVNKEVIEAKVEEVKSNLPAGFFDENVNPTVEIEPEEEMKEEISDEQSKSTIALPDGFFDDAREDAKARKIVYKDPAEVEWEKFQSEMEAEDVRYNDILAEDDQKLREDRDVDIGLEQKLWSYRVESINDSAETGKVCPDDIVALETKLKFEVKDEVKKEEADEEMAEPSSSLLDTTGEVKMESESDSDMDDDSLMDWRTKRKW